jgi:hypothetical protein
MLFKKLFDSTFYYCADQKLYQQFLAEHPQYKAPPSQPAPGRYAIRLSSYADHYALPCRQQHWLLKNHNPVGHYKTGILLYEIKAIQ